MLPQELIRDHYPTLLHPGQSLTVEPATPGFSGARVFRAEIDGAAFCVRQWPSAMPKDRLRAIHRLLAHVQRTSGAATPVPVSAADGATTVELSGHSWQVEPWLPGKALTADELTEDRLHAAMRGIAKWHLSAGEYTPPRTDTEWLLRAHDDVSPTIADRLRTLAGWRDDFEAAEHRLLHEADNSFRELGQRVTTFARLLIEPIGQELQQIEKHSVRLQPCIRDLWSDHLLFTGDELTGVIDFGAVRTDSVACDLSRLLGSLFEDDSTKWNAALDIYAAVRPLSEAEQQLLRPLDRSNVLLSGLTWLRRRWEGRIDEAQLPRVVDRMEAIVRRLEHLAGW